MDFRKVKPSTNLIDRTGLDTVSEIDWIYELGHKNLTNKELERVKKMTPAEYNNLLFQAALETWGDARLSPQADLGYYPQGELLKKNPTKENFKKKIGY